ncbi:DUF6470 family protein [Pseudobacteroides cellulosolvens]|uniref:Uncharacterized protein n=1 Tax=Pseudobacteroides cellulosolvens ATCC 35603 = DSM 2933 TaxID=398512 RepID=A0A0L6JSC0_9FIRM|nr:DUF6470 family protein [Pseudobacteroides cellulosolvens]KNY28625.1 hypothetical protein Bccel_3899 [Pseudobacteroides cellulosolvens ATCC 35603 = DSM 2933]
MSLEISQTYARLGVDRTQSSFEIKTKYATLELDSKEPKINIRTELPKVEIDQYECFASAGLKNPLDLTEDMVERSKENAIEYIGKIAADGDMLAAIEKGGHPIPEIAARDAYPQHEFGMVTIPSTGPKITVTGSLEIEPERTSEGANNGVDAVYTPGELDIRYTPDKIRFYMEQYASVNIKYIPENNIDEKV